MAPGLTGSDGWTAEDEAFWEKSLLSPGIDSILTGVALVAFAAGIVAILLLGAEINSALQGLLQVLVHEMNHVLGGGTSPRQVLWR